VGVLLLVIDYELLINGIATFTGSQKHLTEIRDLIKPREVKLLTGYIFFNFIISVLILTKFNSINTYFYPIVRKTAYAIRSRIRHDYSAPFLYLLIIPVLSTLFHAFTMPVGNDEAYTYVNYTSRSIFACAFYYPDPNNHILHSILTNVFTIFHLPALATLRIPVILVSTLNLFVFFSLVKEYSNKKIAFSAVAIYSVFIITQYYSYLSRGYALQAFAFLIATYSLFKIIKNPGNKVYWFYYIMGSAMGFYTITSFLYPYLMITLFMLVRFRKITREFLISNIIIMVIVFYLYVPVIIFSGIDSVIGNKFVIPIERSEVIERLPRFLLIAINEITGFNGLIVLAIVIVATVMLFKRFPRLFNYYFIWIISLVPVLLLLHSVIPFTRTFNYWGFSLALCLAVLVFFMVENIRFKVPFILLLMILQSGMVIHFNFKVKDKEAHSLAVREEIEKVREGKNFYVCSSLFDKYLTYDLVARNQSDFHIKYYKAKPVNLDTVPQKEKYDFLIVDSAMDLTKDLSPISKNKIYSIYKGH